MSDDGVPVLKTRGSRVAVVFASGAIVLSMALVAVDRLFLPERFSIREVVVNGNAPNVDPALVMRAVQGLGQRSWFSVDLDEVDRAVRKVPWVYDVAVRRRWPGKLVVTVSQATPAARWNDDGWVNGDGERLVIPPGFSGDGLPRLHGPAGSGPEVVARYREIAAVLAARGQPAPASLRVDARGAWEMTITGLAAQPVPVRIGREEALRRVERLAAALDGGLAGTAEAIEHVDLRYPNGFSVKTAAQDEPGQLVDSARARSGGGSG